MSNIFKDSNVKKIFETTDLYSILFPSVFDFENFLQKYLILTNKNTNP